MAESKFEENKVYEIPLNKVKADYEWNSRSNAGQFTETDGEKEGTSLEQLMSSIDQQGQREPVLLRPVKGGYALVYGFRRYAALMKLEEKNKKGDATIRAYIRELNEVEAREENLRENVSREQLRPVDLVRGLGSLRKLYSDNNVKYTVQGLADKIGINRPYASLLFKILDKVPDDIMTKWYTQPSPIGVNRMEAVANADDDKKEAVFAAKTETGKRGRGGSHAGWLERASNKCNEVGALLGSLEAKGRIDTEMLDFSEHLAECIGELAAETTDEEKDRLVETIKTAYEGAIEAVKNPPKEEPKEEKKSKGKAKKNAEAKAEAN